MKVWHNSRMNSMKRRKVKEEIKPLSKSSRETEICIRRNFKELKLVTNAFMRKSSVVRNF